MTDAQAKRMWTHPEHLRLKSYEVTRCSACGSTQRRSRENWRATAPHKVFVYSIYTGLNNPRIEWCNGGEGSND